MKSFHDAQLQHYIVLNYVLDYQTRLEVSLPRVAELPFSEWQKKKHKKKSCYTKQAAQSITI